MCDNIKNSKEGKHEPKQGDWYLCQRKSHCEEQFVFIGKFDQKLERGSDQWLFWIYEDNVILGSIPGRIERYCINVKELYYANWLPTFEEVENAKKNASIKN